jgi:hypothetical protein
VATAVLSPVTAAALVAAGLLSVLVFPATALVLLRRRPSEHAVAPSGESEAQVHPCGGTAGAGLGRTIRL